MSVKILRKAVTEPRTIQHEVRPQLVASVCDNCGGVFGRTVINNVTCGVMGGIFQTPKAVVDEYGKGMGNLFHADICSYICAHAILVNWKTKKKWKPYADAGATLVRTTLSMTNLLTEEELLKDWEASANQE